MTTVLCGIAGSAFAHDNFKTQLDSLNSAWECQDHFDRGTDIAGTIDEFEFCVWYLNSDSKGFFRNDMYYDILPSGDVIAVKANQLRTAQSAEKAINEAIQIIIEEKIIEVEIPGETKIIKVPVEVIKEKIIEVESGEIIDALTSKLEIAQNTLTEAASQAVIDADMISKLANDLAATSAALTTAQTAQLTLQGTINKLEDKALITAAEVTALVDMLDVKTKALNAKATELYLAEVKVGEKQREIDDLVVIRDNLTTTNAELQTRINTVIGERDTALKEVSTLTESLNALANHISPAEVEKLKAAARTEGYNYAIPYIQEAQQRAFNAEAQVKALTADVKNFKDQVETLADEKQDLQDIIDEFDVTSDNADAIASYLEDARKNATITADLDAKATRANTFASVQFNEHPTTGVYSYSIRNSNGDLITAANHPAGGWLVQYLETVNFVNSYGFDYQPDFHDISEAYQEGYAKGFDDGYKIGYRDGFKDGVASVN